MYITPTKIRSFEGVKNNTVLAVGKASTAFLSLGSVSVRSPLDSSSTACALLFFTFFESKTLALKALKKSRLAIRTLHYETTLMYVQLFITLSSH